MSHTPPQPVRVEWKLIVDDGSNAVKVFPVTRDEFIIGRALTADIHLEDAHISRRHVRLTRQGDQLIIEDLQTVNGTLVNGQQLTGRYALQPDDVIGLGRLSITVEQAFLSRSRQETRPYNSPAQATSRLVLLMVAAVIGLILICLFGWGLYQFNLLTNPGTNTDLSAAFNAPTVTIATQLDTPTPILSLVEEASPTPISSPTIVPLLPTETPTLAPTTTPLATATDTPLPTPSPIPATPTPGQALFTLNVPTLNVRTGPGTQYSLIGQLVQGTQAEIVGQADGGQGLWWEIRFAGGSGGVGWVSADPTFGTASNVTAVPVVSIATPAGPSPQPPAVSAQPSPIPPPTATASAAPGGGTVIRAPAGKTLLIVSNRSLANQPALLTLSGGKSVGGGREIDAPAGSDIQLELEPDFYRALWSSPARPGGFVRGADFTAIKDKIMVMWIVPEAGRTDIEIYDELTVGGPAPTATPAPVGTATPVPIAGNYVAPAGKAIFVAANRTLNNSFADLTLSGGSFGGGQLFKLDAGVEIPIELLPGNYRAVWTSPARQGGFSAGREFNVSGRDVILSWIVPDQGQVFMQFPGQEPQQINN